MFRRLISLLCCAVLAAASPPSTLRIGGLFSIMDENGNIDLAGVQQQAAFLMAIRAINDKGDGVMDEILPNTEIKFAARHVVSKMDVIERSLDLVYVEMNSSTGVDIVINALGPALSSVENDIFDSRDIPSVRAVYNDHVVSRSTQISMVPLASRQAIALANVICDYGVEKIVIIMESSEYGVGMMHEMMHSGACDFDVLNTLVLAPTSFDLMDQMRLLDTSSAIVFCILVKDPVVVANILETGFELDLFRRGREVLLSDEVISSPILYESFQDTTIISAVMRGILGMHFDTNYHVAFSDVGASFFARWCQQSITSASALEMCSDETDDSTEAYYLHSNQQRTTCYGLNFTEFSSEAALDSNVASVYDAVMSVALGVHYLVEAQAANMAVTSEEFKLAIVEGIEWYQYKGIVYYI
jgi:hypothetical protein